MIDPSSNENAVVKCFALTCVCIFTIWPTIHRDSRQTDDRSLWQPIVARKQRDARFCMRNFHGELRHHYRYGFIGALKGILPDSNYLALIRVTPSYDANNITLGFAFFYTSLFQYQFLLGHFMINSYQFRRVLHVSEYSQQHKWPFSSRVSVTLTQF